MAESQGYFASLRNRMMGAGSGAKPTVQTGGQGNATGTEGAPNPQGTQSPTGGAGDPNAQQKPQGQNPANWMDDLYTSKQEDPEMAPQFTLAADKLQGLSDSQQFVSPQDITPEMQQKFQQGDFSDMVTLINRAGQRAHRASLEHSSTLTGKFVEARDGFNQKSFGSRVRGENVGQELSKLPNYSRPAVKQHLNDIANRLARQHPDASPQEIAGEAQRMLMEIAGEANPSAGKDPEAQQPTDWSEWLGRGNGN